MPIAAGPTTLGDEIPDPQRALDLLNWWEEELNASYQAKPSHPVFIALRETIVAKIFPRSRSPIY